MRARLTSSHFVGRVGELAELELAWREAASGRPVVVLVGGDSGVGKTRLITEFEQRLGGSGARVLRGEGVEQGDGELPYAPLLSALRPLVRESASVLAELTPATRVQLGALLPGLSEAADTSAGTPADGSGQLRLFEALLELIDRLSRREALVLALEDMHWADRSTRTFVAFLARGLRHERVMLVLTYRADELHRRHPLRPLLSELERLERARRVDLSPFDRAELAEVLADILGDAPRDELLERLFARSEGNPLYTEELLAFATRSCCASSGSRRRRSRRRGRSRWVADLTRRRLARPPDSPPPLCRRRCGRRLPSRSSWRARTVTSCFATRCCARWSTTIFFPASEATSISH